jgi:hypothetical protein
VSRGTVYRAIDKSKGPLRQTIANIGILQTEPYDPKKFAAHREAPPDRNGLNKKKYIYSTVQWIIKKVGSFYFALEVHTNHLQGQLADNNEPVQERNHRVIPVDQPWKIKQSIYYNPLIENPQDHYPVDHPKNAGELYNMA